MKRERRLESGGDDWEIRQDGVQLLIDDGVKQSTRKFVSIDHAGAQFDKLVAEKLAAGWEDATGRKRTRRTAAEREPRDPALEAAVLANRDDRDARAVYGDWYEARGHPRGALVAMQLDDRSATRARGVAHTGSTASLVERERYGDETRAERIHRHLQRYKVELLGPLDKYVQIDGESPFEWLGGFIHAVELVPHDTASPQQILRDVVAHPSGRLLAEVTSVITKRPQASGVVGALRKHPILALKLVTDQGLRDELAKLGSLATLRRFALSVVECPSDERPHAIETSANVLHAVSALPASVEHLELRLDGVVDDPRALSPLFRRDDLKLRTFALRAPEVLAAMLDRLLDAPWAVTLSTLDAALIRAERLWDVVLANRARFPALAEIRLTANMLPARRLDELRERYRIVDVRDDDDVAFFEASVGEEYFYRPVSE